MSHSDPTHSDPTHSDPTHSDPEKTDPKDLRIGKSRPVIIADRISKQVTSGAEPIQILTDISLKVFARETMAVRGRSGSGKSTLLVILAGLESPSSGALTLMDKNLVDATESERTDIRRAHVGFVFQSFQLIPSLPARENVALALEVSKQIPVDEALPRADDLLTDLGLGHRLHHLPNQLSGGEQQRVAIARAFINEPALLFADEPTGNLDQTNGDLVSEMLFSLVKDQGSTLILVTHDDQLGKRCDREVFLDHGNITADTLC